MAHDNLCRCRRCKPPLAPGETIAEYRALQRVKICLLIGGALTLLMIVTRPYW
jgi:hypothetical protein